MKLYVAYHDPKNTNDEYTGAFIIGIYEKKEDAQEAVENFLRYFDDDENIKQCDCHIECHELNNGAY